MKLTKFLVALFAAMQLPSFCLGGETLVVDSAIEANPLWAPVQRCIDSESPKDLLDLYSWDFLRTPIQSIVVPRSEKSGDVARRALINIMSYCKFIQSIQEVKIIPNTANGGSVSIKFVDSRDGQMAIISYMLIDSRDRGLLIDAVNLDFTLEP